MESEAEEDRDPILISGKRESSRELARASEMRGQTRKGVKAESTGRFGAQHSQGATVKDGRYGRRLMWKRFLS